MDVKLGAMQATSLKTSIGKGGEDMDQPDILECLSLHKLSIVYTLSRHLGRTDQVDDEDELIEDYFSDELKSMQKDNMIYILDEEHETVALDTGMAGTGS
ncbi:hypothetical protein Tco_1314317 [Tanacetum coccineum]